MAEYGHQGGRRVDEYGNPIPEVYNATGAGTGSHGTTGVGHYGTGHQQGGLAAAGGGGHGQLNPSPHVDPYGNPIRESYNATGAGTGAGHYGTAHQQGGLAAPGGGGHGQLNPSPHVDAYGNPIRESYNPTGAGTGSHGMTGIGHHGTGHQQGGLAATGGGGHGQLNPSTPVDAYSNPIRESYNATGAGTGAHGTTGVGPYGTGHQQGGVAAAGGGGHGQLNPSPHVDAYGNPIRESYNATGAGTGSHGMSGVGHHGTGHQQGGLAAAGGGGHGQLNPSTPVDAYGNPIRESYNATGAGSTGAHGMTGVGHHGTGHPQGGVAAAGGVHGPSTPADDYRNPTPESYNTTGAGTGAHRMTGIGHHRMGHQQGGVTAPWPKPCPPVDAYGNPIRESYNATGAAAGAHGKTGVGPYGTAQPQGAVPAVGGAGHGQLKPERVRGHRRSGSSSSSSSSSSEDDGMGGRRKKGLKQKIKEKVPGGRKTTDEHRYAGQTAPMTTATATAPPTAAEGGMPGSYKTDNEHRYAGQTAPMTTATPTEPTTTTTAPPTAAEGGYGKKGVMQKIKEKLPGGGH